MAINYMPQAPVAGAYSAALAIGRAQNEAAARARGSGGGNYSEVNPAVVARLIEGDADRIQGAILTRDRMQADRDRFQAELESRPQLANLQAQNEAGLVQLRLAGQVALQNNEMSQQERIRYMRMKNALGTIETDPTLSADEKAAMRLQIETGINPYEQRIAKERLEIERMQKQSYAEARQAQAALDEQRLKYSSGAIDDKIQVRARPEVIDSIRSEILDLHPELDPSQFRSFVTDPPEVQADKQAKRLAAEEALKRAIDQEAAKRGMAERWIVSEKGIPERIDESKFGDVGKNAPGSQKSQRSQGRGTFEGPLSQQDFFRQYDTAAASVDKRIEAGSLKAEDREAAIQKEIADKQAAYGAYTQSMTPKVGKPAPFTSIGQASEKQKIQIEKTTDVVNNIIARTDLTDAQKSRLQTVAGQYMNLLAKYTDANGVVADSTPQAIKAKIREYAAELNKYESGPVATAASQQAARPGQPAKAGGRIGADPSGATTNTLRRNWNAFLKGLDVIGEAADDLTTGKKTEAERQRNLPKLPGK